MAASKFYQWNPEQSNQETDAQYLLDAMRAGGATAGAIFASPLGNKLFYQVSTFVAAFAQMMANKGYDINDNDFATLVSVLTNVKTASEFLTAIVVVPFASSVNFNAGTSAQFDLTLTGNVVSSTLTGMTDGQVINLIISQDNVGGRTIAFPTNMIGAGAVCPYANSTSIQQFVVRPASVTSGAARIVAVTPMIWLTSTGIVPQSRMGVLSISATGNVLPAFEQLIESVDASGGAITRTLYDATKYPVGFVVNVRKADTTPNAVTIAGFGGQLINGQSNLVNGLPFQSFALANTGSGWLIF